MDTILLLLFIIAGLIVVILSLCMEDMNRKARTLSFSVIMLFLIFLTAISLKDIFAAPRTNYGMIILLAMCFGLNINKFIRLNKKPHDR